MNEAVASEACIDNGVVAVKAQRPGDLPIEQFAILRRCKFPRRVRRVTVLHPPYAGETPQVVRAVWLAVVLDIGRGGTDNVAYAPNRRTINRESRGSPMRTTASNPASTKSVNLSSKEASIRTAGYFRVSAPSAGTIFKRPSAAGNSTFKTPEGVVARSRMDRSALSNSANILSHV